jgi:hypothetical protein
MVKGQHNHKVQILQGGNLLEGDSSNKLEGNNSIMTM